MNIPEVTESQLTLMKEVCFDPEMSVFSQTSPKEGDHPVMAKTMQRAAEDADYLCTLEFLKNITAEHAEKVKEIEAQTQRSWRIFEITALGRAMFQVNAVSVNN